MSQRVLIRTPNHLGDCIMALPMINETREAYPGATITVLTPENMVELFQNNAGVDEILVIPMQYVHGLVSVFKIKDMLTPHDFDVGYILPPSFGAASAFKLAGVKERIGYIVDGRRMILTKPLPLPTPLNSQHRSTVYFDLLRRGSGAALEEVKPKLFLGEEDSHKGMALLSGYDISDLDQYAVVAFRAVAESRRWGTEKYKALAAELNHRFGLKVVLVGSAADQAVGDEICEGQEGTVIANLAGKTSLRELAAICSRAQVFVGNDSGPAHLAAAVGVPVVVLSGADDPKETSPIASRKRLIYLDHLDCISCVKNKCPLKGDDFMRCMNEITVEQVCDSVSDLIEEGQ